MINDLLFYRLMIECLEKIENDLFPRMKLIFWGVFLAAYAAFLSLTPITLDSLARIQEREPEFLYSLGVFFAIPIMVFAMLLPVFVEAAIQNIIQEAKEKEIKRFLLMSIFR